MAFEDFDDYERSEYAAKWLRENAMSIISGLGLGLLLIFGINQWRVHQATHRAEAATQYQLMTQALDANQTDAARTIAATLQDQYKDTPFAVFSALLQAEMAVQDDKAAEAELPLRWASEHAREKALRELAQLRLARVQLALEKPDAALATLGALPAGSYAAEAAELRGDALLQQDDASGARSAYEQARELYDAGAAPVALVELKLDNLPASGSRGS